MSFYTPVPDKIVNGNIADADDIANELNAIKQGFDSVEQDLSAKKTESVEEAKAYTDSELQQISIDGGTY